MSENTVEESGEIRDFPEILGIYSSEEDNEDGSGDDRKSVPVTMYWYVRQISEDTFDLQRLNSNHLPHGDIREIDLALFSKLKPEPSYYMKIALPAIESLKQKIERGEKYFDKGLFSAAEREFLDALKLDDSNAQANFGLGEVYAEKKDYPKVKKLLGSLLEMDGTFREEHRQRFNSLGVALRKNGLFEEAIKYYAKALEYDDKDDHLHFNMARAYFENDQYGKCEDHVAEALKLNPDFREAKLFKQYLEENAPAALTQDDQARPQPQDDKPDEPVREE